ncbi:BTB 2 and zf-CCHC domain containing protein [Trichuris trichiura]|uniref:BTB 2 and zf-CCHC domain containing protein n=1 Tax=Trichuris trichiura TaxID=36087 RepID=A0A077ZNR2_TRITR|nr:BTB 2 and zf-CCHC domain containing protein [Trichuris trichiura]
MKADEPPDTFLAKLRRLAALFGGVSEKTLACAFVAGLPGRVRQLLRAGARTEELSLNQLLARARAIIVDDRPAIFQEACLGTAESEPRSRSVRSGRRCFSCGGMGHFARECPTSQPNPGGGEKKRSVLVDIGCSTCVAHVASYKSWKRRRVSIVTVDCMEWRCQGYGAVCLESTGGGRVMVNVIVADTKPLGFDFILSMNGIAALGGVSVDGQRRVRFGVECAAVCATTLAGVRFEEKDFAVTFDPVARSWTAAWKWSDGERPAVLKNYVKEYSPTAWAVAQYEKELDNVRGPAKGLIPLMAIVQQKKGKVRPVLDFRELNAHIETYTAEADVCASKLREWRRQGVNVSLIDLKDTYLQVHVDEALWPYQTVEVKGRRYCLTRLGFGLNVAPLVMKTVLSCVLSRDPVVKNGTWAYIDDVLLRVAAAFTKRTTNAVTKTWDRPVENGAMRSLLEETAARVKKQDPAQGTWDVSGDNAVVWVDAIDCFCNEYESILAQLVREQWHPEKGVTEVYVHRDPTVFQFVLNYLRNGIKAVLPNNRTLLCQLAREAEFYQLHGLLPLLWRLCNGCTIIEKPIQVIHYYFTKFTTNLKLL